MVAACRIAGFVCTGAALFAALAMTSPADDKSAEGPALAQWEKDVRARVQKDARLRAAAAKCQLVVLHSRKLYAQGDYKQSAYSFIYETAEPAAHRNDVHLLFDNGGEPRTFEANMHVGQQ